MKFNDTDIHSRIPTAKDGCESEDNIRDAGTKGGVWPRPLTHVEEAGIMASTLRVGKWPMAIRIPPRFATRKRNTALRRRTRRAVLGPMLAFTKFAAEVAKGWVMGSPTVDARALPLSQS